MFSNKIENKYFFKYYKQADHITLNQTIKHLENFPTCQAIQDYLFKDILLFFFIQGIISLMVYQVTHITIINSKKLTYYFPFYF